MYFQNIFSTAREFCKHWTVILYNPYPTSENDNHAKYKNEIRLQKKKKMTLPQDEACAD